MSLIVIITLNVDSRIVQLNLILRIGKSHATQQAWSSCRGITMETTTSLLWVH